LLYAVAHSYCEANNLDITPEAHTGRGPVDFKISSGFTGRVLVEVKLSSNPNIVHGYEKQLEIYKTGERTARAFYVVIDVDERLSTKSRPLFDLQRKAKESGRNTSEIVLIDGLVKPSASKAAE
jgi:predicted RNA-binding protein YlxR (DUF448 family)